MKTNQLVSAKPRPGYGPLPTTKVSRRVTHLSVARAKILKILVDHPKPASVTSLSILTAQHPNTIREHLDGLVVDGLAIRSRTVTQPRGRPAWLYQSASDFDSDPLGREYVGLASALAGQIAQTSAHPRADAIAAGRRWGRELMKEFFATGGGRSKSEVTAGAADAHLNLLALLRELGFAPSLDPGLNIIRLHRCPLLQAAHQFPEVICGVHLGIIRGALSEWGTDAEQVEAVDLQAFSEQGACRLELSPIVSNIP